jgi:hypothetical protein
MSEREHSTAPNGEGATGESAAAPVRPRLPVRQKPAAAQPEPTGQQEPPTQPEPSAQTAQARTRISNLSRWTDRDRQLHYEGPLAPQDRYPGRIAAP